MALKEFELGTQGTSTYLFCHLLLFLWLKSDFPPGGFEKIQNPKMVREPFPKAIACSTGNQFKNSTVWRRKYCHGLSEN